MALLSRAAVGGDAQRAAGVAALIGKQDIRTVLAAARRTFTGVSLARLQFEHLASSEVDERIASLASRCALGEVDAFLSHSWHDPAAPKWRALQRWRRDFEEAESGGRSPVVWFDRCCIDQRGDIEAQLTSLPVFLAGCRSLLVLLGPTYTQRIWCVLEIFTFLTAGRTVEQLKIVPVIDGTGGVASPVRAVQSALAEAPPLPAPVEAEVEAEGGEDEEIDEALAGEKVVRALRSFESFDVADAQCSNEDHRQHLLGVIENGFGSFAVFNSLVKHILTSDKVVRQISGDAARQRTRSKPRKVSATASTLVKRSAVHVLDA